MENQLLMHALQCFATLIFYENEAPKANLYSLLNDK